MLVELIGPAGAGKSSLSRALCARGGAQRVTMGDVPRPLLARHSLRLARPWLEVLRSSGSLHWRAFKHVVRLHALTQRLDALRNGGGGRDGIIVLDEGPIFGLSWLSVFGPDRLDGRGAWRPTLERGAALVDAVVALDAPDPVLARRIRRRPKPHPVKDLTDAEIFEFSTRFRIAFQRVLAELAAHRRPPPQLLILSTGGATPGELAERVLVALENGRHAR